MFNKLSISVRQSLHELRIRLLGSQNDGLPPGLAVLINSLSPRLRDRLIKEIIRVETKYELAGYRYFQTNTS
jgi:hypothetical protein